MARRTGSTVMDLGPQVWLAAFGKHPGWNDHMDDLGVETDRLVSVKRALYADGIGGVIDSGGWESLEGSRRTEGFDHAFLWRHHEGLVVGRIWSSSDGRGRKRYPMILAAQCGGVAMRFATERILPRLRQLEDECRAAESAATVISLVDAARAELRQEAERGARPLPDPLPPPAAVAVLAEREPLGPDREGLHRVLYQLERDFASYRRPERGESGTRSRTMDTRPQQLRVPRVAGTIGEEWGLWMRLVVSQLDPLAPILMITSEAHAWTDIIVGEPGSAQFVCLQASDEAIPLTTSIPYTFDAAFKSRADALVEEGRRGGIVEHDPAHIAVPSDRLAQLTRAAAGGSSRGAGGGGLPKPVIIAAVAGVALLAAALAALMLLGGGPPDGTPEGDTAGEVAEEVTFSQAEAQSLEALEAWAAAADDWLLAFVDRAAEIEPGDDEHLAAIVSIIRVGVDGSGPEGFDPANALDVEDAEDAPRRELAERVRSGELDDTISGSNERIAVAAGLEAARRLEAMLDPDRWTAAARVETLADELERRGAGDAAEALRVELAALSTGTGRERAEAVAAIASSAVAVERLLADLRAIDRGAAAAAALSGWMPGGVEAAPAGYDDLSTAAVRAAAGSLTGLDRVGFAVDRIEPVAGIAVELAAFVDRTWPRIDRAAFAADPASRGRAETVAELSAWLSAASDPAFAEADPSADPRAASTVADRLAELEERLASIASTWTGDDDTGAGVVGLLDRVRGLERRRAELAAEPWRNATRADIERDAARLESDEAALRAESDAFVATLAGSIAEYIERLPRGLSSRGIEPIDRAWADAVEAFAAEAERDDGLEPAELKARVDATRDALLDVERRLAEPELPRDSELIDRAAAAAAVRTATDTAAASAVDALAWDGDRFSAALGDAAESEIDSANDRLDAFAAMTADAAWIERHLAEGGRPDAAAEGASPVERAERWRAHGLAADDRAWSAVSAAFERLDRVAALSSADTETQIEAAGAGPFAVRLAAWRGLVENASADSVDSHRLAVVASAFERLRADAARRARGEALVDELDAGGFDLWRTAALSAGDRAELSRVAAQRAALGVDARRLDTLEPALAFDLALLAFAAEAAELADTAPGDAAELDRRWSIVESAAAAAGVGDEALREVRTILSAPADASGAEARVDPSEIGPGRLGWRGVWIDGERLEYTSESGVKLRFALAEPVGGEPAMLGEHEAPIALLTRHIWVDDELRSAVEPYLGDPVPASEMVGPRTWVWSGGRPALATEWLRPKAMGESDISGPGRGPTPRTPLTRVTRLAAAAIAAATGCRLASEGEWRADRKSVAQGTAAELGGPRSIQKASEGEWRAAYEASGSPAPGPDVNLRDASFAARRDALAASRLEDWPDEEVFLSRNDPEFDPADAPALEADDGALWFVADEGGAGFAHVVGNVAEYVAVYEGEGAAARGDVGEGASGLSADMRALLRGGGLRVGGIGGSALSPPPPNPPVDRVRVMPSRVRSGGYTDVGFRLAFGLNGRSVSRSPAARAADAAGRVSLLTVEGGG